MSAFSYGLEPYFKVGYVCDMQERLNEIEKAKQNGLKVKFISELDWDEVLCDSQEESVASGRTRAFYCFLDNTLYYRRYEMGYLLHEFDHYKQHIKYKDAIFNSKMRQGFLNAINGGYRGISSPDNFKIYIQSLLVNYWLEAHAYLATMECSPFIFRDMKSFTRHLNIYTGMWTTMPMSDADIEVIIRATQTQPGLEEFLDSIEIQNFILKKQDEKFNSSAEK